MFVAVACSMLMLCIFFGGVEVKADLGFHAELPESIPTVSTDDMEDADEEESLVEVNDESSEEMEDAAEETEEADDETEEEGSSSEEADDEDSEDESEGESFLEISEEASEENAAAEQTEEEEESVSSEGVDAEDDEVTLIQKQENDENDAILSEMDDTQQAVAEDSEEDPDLQEHEEALAHLEDELHEDDMDNLPSSLIQLAPKVAAKNSKPAARKASTPINRAKIDEALLANDVALGIRPAPKNSQSYPKMEVGLNIDLPSELALAKVKDELMLAGNVKRSSIQEVDELNDATENFLVKWEKQHGSAMCKKHGKAHKSGKIHT